MTNNHDNRDRPASPLVSRKWLPWILGGLGVLLLLLLLSRCGSDNDEVVTTPTAAVAAGEAAVPAPAAIAAPVGISTLDAYLTRADAAPRTFTFEKVHFDTGSSEIRASDRAEIHAVAGVLQRYPSTKVRLVGYADARGADPANAALAQARANVVRSALAAAGVDARRVEAVSGGETNPVGSNASPSGMAENRRTELVVMAR